MASPLLAYVNAYLVFTSEGTPEIANGRVVASGGQRYIVEAFLTRQDGTSTSTGADYYPSRSNPGEMMPGSGGGVSVYRGYGLRYASVGDGFDIDVDGVPSSGWTVLNASNVPAWLVNGVQCVHKQGREPAKVCGVEFVTGKYGGSGIDQLVSDEVGGIPLVVYSGTLLN